MFGMEVWAGDGVDGVFGEIAGRRRRVDLGPAGMESNLAARSARQPGGAIEKAIN